MPTVMLVDGTALAYRAYFAFIRNPLINSKGENTSASYGFATILVNLLKKHQPDYLGVAFDTKAPTFRHVKFEAYKAQRPGMPDELKAQLPRIKQVLRAMEIAVLENDGYEADDVLAGLAKQAEAKNWPSYIVTGDKDLLQIVTDKIKVIRPRTGKNEEQIFGPAEVQREYGVIPDKIKDIFALSGDAADNVPGVPGIGPKTATELIIEFGSFDNLYQNLDQVKKPRIKKLLEDNREQAVMSRELVTLHLDELPLVSLSDLRVHEPDRERVSQLFRELEFGSLLREFQAGQVKSVEFQTVKAGTDLELVLGKIKKTGELYFEPEFRQDQMFRAAVMVDGKPLIVENKNLAKLKPIWANHKITKIGHDLKSTIRKSDLDMGGPMFDTMLASYLIDPSWRHHQSLDSLAGEHLGLAFEAAQPSAKKQTELAFEIDDQTRDQLLGRRLDAIKSLKEKFQREMDEKNLTELFQKVEMPLLAVLAEMESFGVLLDLNIFKTMSRDLEKQIGKLEKQIYKEAGEEFNINSPKQLGVILFEKLKVGKAKKTKTGYSTDVSVLESFANVHPLPRLILDYRQLFKLKSTYVDALPALVSERTGRLHTTFNQALTETGRLSSSDPNLQNIPMREGVGREIRKGFIAEKGHLLLSADYSQVELRLVAHLSGDQRLQQAFKSRRDIHTETACAVFGIESNEVTPDMRRKAKAINFGIIYGMGPYGLAQQLGIGVGEAAAFIEQYFQQFPQVQAWIALTTAQAKKDGFVCTMLGRRRYLPEINSDNGQRRAFAERTAVNTPIQGTAADLIKLAMVNIQAIFQKEKLKSRMILQVHDELLFEVEKGELARVKKIVKQEMENAIEISVPVVVEMGEGENWFQAH
ncbi:MAG: DNA polymerase I [Candidatus Edwardsbacteria bacterium]|nr:DNA polymerase I [Candidatus Edwardsbacteria bacterium]